LTAKDFSPEFQALAAADLKPFGFSEDSLAKWFSSVSTLAKPVSFSAFRNQTHIVIGMVLYPLTTQETAQFDLDLANPNSALGKGMPYSYSQATILPGYDKIGDKSVGFTYLLASSGSASQIEYVVIRRGNSIEMVLSIYQRQLVGGEMRGDPSANLAELVKALDARTAAGLGIK
jgi:hypothetical protein